MCVQDTLEKHQLCLKMQREAVKQRVRQLAAHQSEICVSSRHISVPLRRRSSYCDDDWRICLQKKSSVIKQNIICKYQEIQAVLDEDLKVTLSHLEMEERAAVSALDAMMEKNHSLMREIEQDLIRLSVSINQVNAEMVIKLNSFQRLNLFSFNPWGPEDREQVFFCNQYFKTDVKQLCNSSWWFCPPQGGGSAKQDRPRLRELGWSESWPDPQHHQQHAPADQLTDPHHQEALSVLSV